MTPLNLKPGDRVCWPDCPDDTGTVVLDAERAAIRWDRNETDGETDIDPVDLATGRILTQPDLLGGGVVVQRVAP